MRLIPFALCLLSTLACAQQKPARSCRILFLGAPPDAPETLQLVAGTGSQEVELPRMNFSPVYQLPGGALRLHLLPTVPDDPAAIPAGAPTATVGEAVSDFHLLVTSDPDNQVAPVRMQVIDIGGGKLRSGQQLWFNLTDKPVAGTVGSRRLAIRPKTRIKLDPPATGHDNYPVKLSFRIPGKEHVYPLCETQWLHDPRSRSVVFILDAAGSRTPRILSFPDYREPESGRDGGADAGT
jgi:hypothetical protein